ncbi:MAG: AAA family ATPase [Patescibacteria group bacterium]
MSETQPGKNGTYSDNLTPAPAPSPAPQGGVKVNFANASKKSTNPFITSTAEPKRLKLFLWGPPGVGKTRLALSFPDTAMIDMEGGTDHYKEEFKFDLIKTTTADQVMEAVKWLASNNHSYKTLVIDPITVYWEALQKKWSDIFMIRNQESRGNKHDYYSFQARDWMPMKAELKELIRRLVDLDMNVIVTARQKVLYQEGGGDFMKKIGDTFDGEKGLPYLFDTIVQMFQENGKIMGRTIKDRSNRLPVGAFECSYPVFESMIGKRSLEKKSVKINFITDAQKKTIMDHLARLGLTEDKIIRSLNKYDADEVDDLTEANAALIIQKLEQSKTK